MDDATNIIVITFSENIAANNNIDKDDFAISVNDLGVGTYFFAPSSAAVVNGKVELTLASAGGWSPPFTSIQAVTVAYTKNTYDELNMHVSVKNNNDNVKIVTTDDAKFYKTSYQQL